MAVLKHSSPQARLSQGGMFDLSDLREGAVKAIEDAREEAVRMVAAARVEADALRANARAEGVTKGYDEGFAKGVPAGRAEGELAGRTSAATLHDASLAAIEEAYSREFLRWIAVRDEVMRTAERELAGIALAIAERVVREHVKCDPTVVAREVEAAVSLFARATRVTIQVAIEDEALVSEAMPALRATLPAGADISLIAVAGIERGGCVIRTSEGSVDARIETQFRRIREGIMGGAPDIADGDAS